MSFGVITVIAAAENGADRDYACAYEVVRIGGDTFLRCTSVTERYSSGVSLPSGPNGEERGSETEEEVLYNAKFIRCIRPCDEAYVTSTYTYTKSLEEKANDNEQV